jgi:hypothetical protein
MSNHPDSTTVPKSIGELSENIVSKLAKARVTNEKVADALRSLDRDVCELMFMADIAVGAWDDIGPPATFDANSVTYRVARDERDRFDFILNNVAERAALLKKRFVAASYGETV